MYAKNLQEATQWTKPSLSWAGGVGPYSGLDGVAMWGGGTRVPGSFGETLNQLSRSLGAAWSKHCMPRTPHLVRADTILSACGSNFGLLLNAPIHFNDFVVCLEGPNN